MNDYILNVDITLFDMVSMIRGANMTNDTFVFRRFIDNWYHKMTEEARVALFDLVVNNVYHKCFTPNPILSGVDRLFLARFNPNTQVEVEYKTTDGRHNVTRAFTSEGQYYMSSYETIPKEIINKTEYI